MPGKLTHIGCSSASANPAAWLCSYLEAKLLQAVETTQCGGIPQKVCTVVAKKDIWIWVTGPLVFGEWWCLNLEVICRGWRGKNGEPAHLATSQRDMGLSQSAETGPSKDRGPRQETLMCLIGHFMTISWHVWTQECIQVSKDAPIDGAVTVNGQLSNWSALTSDWQNRLRYVSLCAS